MSTVARRRDNTSRQAKAYLRLRAAFADVDNQRRCATKKHRHVMSKAEFRERLMADLEGAVEF